MSSKTYRKGGRRVRRKKNNTKMMVLGILCGLASAAVIFLGVWAIFLRDGNSITGKGGTLYKEWAIDSTTHYRFDEDGKGALVLPTEEYSFSFKIKGDKITIDFDDPKCIDKIYTFSVNGDTMTITSDSDNIFNMTAVK